MTIQELKNQIERGVVDNKVIIFKDNEESFLSNQYIQAISKVTKLPITYIDSPEEVISDAWDVFGCDTLVEGSCLNVCKSEVYEWGHVDISRATNLIIVVTKFADKKVEQALSEYIVSVPPLEEWQIRDYVLSTCEGIAEKNLEWIIKLCNGNMRRLQNELDKFLLFNVDERRYLFDSYMHDRSLNDLSSFNIFNITDAVVRKDLTALQRVYREIDRVDVNEFGLLTLLLKNFKNLIMVQLGINPTPESTGLSSGQLYNTKKLPRVYSPDQLVTIVEFLSDIDHRIKDEGDLPVDLLIDYMLVKILSF